jgi:sulfhydrogenase subunit beta (sulfur reductase)
MKATSRSDLAAWLDVLAERCILIAPRLVEDELIFQPVSSSAEVVFDFQRTTLSPKTFFLPDTQVILEVEKRDKEVALSEPAMEREQVIFGLRPCDAKGLCALDALLTPTMPSAATRPP